MIGFGIREYRNQVLREESIRIEDAFVKASDTAVRNLAQGIRNNPESVLIKVSEDFFTSLSANLYLYEDEERSVEASLYVPLLAVTDVEGFYVCVLSKSNTSQGNLITRKWTECLPYLYEDSNFTYRLYLDGRIKSIHKVTGEIVTTSFEEVMSNSNLKNYYNNQKLFNSEEEYKSVRRSAVAKSIETQVSVIFTTQSYIAGDCGVSISYTCPSFLSVIPEDVAGTFLAIYQGFPSVVGAGYEYSGVQAASYIKEKTLYYVTKPQNGDYYRLAHKKECENCDENAIGPVERDVAVITYGAYGCPMCTTEADGFMSPP